MCNEWVSMGLARLQFQQHTSVHQSHVEGGATSLRKWPQLYRRYIDGCGDTCSKKIAMEVCPGSIVGVLAARNQKSPSDVESNSTQELAPMKMRDR